MSDFAFEIIKQIAVLSPSQQIWKKELNLIKWGNSKPKYDLRSWAPNHEKMTKGISLSQEQLSSAVAILKIHLNDLNLHQSGKFIDGLKYDCQLCKECGTVSTNSKGWSIEVNIVRWKKNSAVFDIRNWGKNRTIIGKGITLNHCETEALLTAHLGILTTASSARDLTMLPNDPSLSTVIDDLFI